MFILWTPVSSVHSTDPVCRTPTSTRVLNRERGPYEPPRPTTSGWIWSEGVGGKKSIRNVLVSRRPVILVRSTVVRTVGWTQSSNGVPFIVPL